MGLEGKSPFSSSSSSSSSTSSSPSLFSPPFLSLFSLSFSPALPSEFHDSVGREREPRKLTLSFSVSLSLSLGRAKYSLRERKRERETVALSLAQFATVESHVWVEVAKKNETITLFLSLCQRLHSLLHKKELEGRRV